MITQYDGPKFSSAILGKNLRQMNHLREFFSKNVVVNYGIKPGPLGNDDETMQPSGTEKKASLSRAGGRIKTGMNLKRDRKPSGLNFLGCLIFVILVANFIGSAILPGPNVFYYESSIYESTTLNGEEIITKRKETVRSNIPDFKKGDFTKESTASGKLLTNEYMNEEMKSVLKDKSMMANELKEFMNSYW